ncbi:MAG: DNA-directed RNA polymerase [Nanoarchaeota archaeon]|nr:DNA-directed RNA polymerase [Nanoarchaeota archaeon]
MNGGFGRRSFGGNRGGGFRRDNDRPREEHKAICADCKQDCVVPFKPTEGKPVYCRECYKNHRKF